MASTRLLGSTVGTGCYNGSLGFHFFVVAVARFKKLCLANTEAPIPVLFEFLVTGSVYPPLIMPPGKPGFPE